MANNEEPKEQKTTPPQKPEGMTESEWLARRKPK